MQLTRSTSARRLPLTVCLLLTVVTRAAAAEQPLVNLALSGSGGMPTALASAPSFSVSPAKACDGNVKTGWVSEKGAFPVWLRVEWRVPVEVHKVVVRHFVDAPLKEAGSVGRYSLQVDRDGEWQTMAEGDASAQALDDELRHKLAAPIRTTALRFLIESAPTGQVGIAELEVLGPEVVLPIELCPRWQARWIWCEPSLVVPHREPIRRYFRRSFEIENPTQLREAWLLACAFDRLNQMWVNNRPALSHISYYGGSLREAKVREVPLDWLVAGENVLASEVDDIYEAGSHGLLAEMVLLGKDGTRTVIATDDQWLGQEDQGVVPDWRKPALTDKRWVPCTVRTWPNTRWHWLWNVPYPMVAPGDRLRVEKLEVAPTPAKPGESVEVTVTLDCPVTPSRDYAAVVRLGEPSYWRNHDFELWGAYLRPEEVGTGQWEPGKHQVTLSVPVPDYAPSSTPATLLLSTTEGAAGLACDLPGVTTDAYGAHFAIEVDRSRRRGAGGSTRWRARLRQGGRVHRAEARGGSTRWRARLRGGFPGAEIRTVAGNPTLHVAGEPVSPILWSSSHGNLRKYSEYAATGVKLFRPIVQGSPIPAPGEEEEYFPAWLAEIDKMLSAAVSIDPEVRLLPAVWMDPNPQWLFDDPSEQMLGGRGQLVIPLGHAVPDRGQVRPTFMSQAWRRDGATGLKRLVEHMKLQPYAGNVIGLCFLAGRAGENYWGGNEYNVFLNEQGRYDCKPRDQWQAGDFSMAARRTFRDFLKAKYGADEALRRAWRQDRVSLDDILEPARFRREEVCDILTWADKLDAAGSMRDPLTPGVGTLPMDYRQCMAEAMSDTFAAWGAAVKEASDGKLLTGCYYGYAISQLYTSIPGFHGHTAIAKAARSPHLDFYVSPSEYNAARRAGGPYWGLNIIDSLRLHNKLWIYEQDTRTYLAEHMPKTFSRRETLEVMKRDAAAALTRGVGWWYYEFSEGQQGPRAREWFMDPEIAKLAGRIKGVYDASLALPDRGPSAEIAVFYHGESLTAQDLFAPTAQINIAIGRLTLVNGMQRIGAPFDMYSLADIPVLKEQGLLEQYRMCLFLNPFYLTQEERGWLELCKGGGRTLVWLWAPGIVRVDKSPSPDNVSEVTEIPGTKWVERKATQVYRLSATDHPITQGLARDTDLAAMPFPPGATWERFGNDVWPLVYVDPGDSEGTTVLGHWVLDGDARQDMAALCVRTVGKGPKAWHSVHAAVPFLTPELMRNIARFAGVHVYRDGNEILFASRHFVAIHTGADPATGELRLPQRTTVYDVFRGETIAQDVEAVSLDIPAYSTRLYYLGDPRKLPVGADRPSGVQ